LTINLNFQRAIIIFSVYIILNILQGVKR